MWSNEIILNFVAIIVACRGLIVIYSIHVLQLAEPIIFIFSIFFIDY